MTEQRGPRDSQVASGAAKRRSFGREVMATRRAVRQTLKPVTELHRQAGAEAAPLVLVALSGGADSLALALALAYEAPKCGVRAGAIIVDHGLQQGSDAVAEGAAAQAQQMGLDPVHIETVRVAGATEAGGPEAAARQARYVAFSKVAETTGAWAILTAHTHNDQAEQVLLALARGSGLRSLAGIPSERVLGDGSEPGRQSGVSTRLLLRPFLAAGASSGTGAGSPVITRAITEAACVDQGVAFWRDPHNADPSYARVRVRERVLPILEAELGPGVADALVRTAHMAREDADALDEIAHGYARGLLGGESNATTRSEHSLAARDTPPSTAGMPLSVAVSQLSDLAPPVLTRVIRVLAQQRFGAYLERVHTLAVADLVTHWRGQSSVYVPGIVVTRRAGQLRFERQVGSPRG